MAFKFIKNLMNSNRGSTTMYRLVIKLNGATFYFGGMNDGKAKWTPYPEQAGWLKDKSLANKTAAILAEAMKTDVHIEACIISEDEKY